MAMFWSCRAPNTGMGRRGIINTKVAFKKSTEHGHAGFYEVTLKDHNILAELTSTPVGIHRYTLNEPDMTWIVDLDHRDDLVHYSIEPEEQGCSSATG